MKRIFICGLALLVVGLGLSWGVAKEEAKQAEVEQAEGKVFSDEKELEAIIDETIEEVGRFLSEVSKKEQASPELPIRVPEVKKATEPIDLEFTQANLEDVLRVIAEAGGFNIVLDPILKGKKVDIHLKGVSINEALELLYSAYGLSPYQIGSTLFISTREKIRQAATITRVYELENINVEEAKALIDTLANVINISKETNTLVVMAAPDDIKKVEDILKKVDVAQSQVILEARVIEINSDALKETGLDWSDSVTVTFQETLRPVDLPDEATPLAKSSLHIYRLARSALNFDAIIKLLEEEGDAKILSSPRITTVNNREAEIFIGDRVPYTITTVTGGVANTEVRFTEAGIRLKITPSIIEEDFTLIKIEPEVSYIYRWRGPNDEYPWVKTRQATAYVRVKNNQSFVLGGLLGKEDKNNLYKVAFLGDIPLLGNLFKYERTEVINSELIITITPTIIGGAT